MKRSFLTTAIALMLSAGWISCSSSDGSYENNGGTTTSTPSGTVPENTDSGKNNNDTPDNPPTTENPGDNGGNTGNGGGDNSGDNSGNTGGDNTGGSGDTGNNPGNGDNGGDDNNGDNTGGDNPGNGNTGGDDNNGDNTGGDNPGNGNTGGGDNSGDNNGGNSGSGNTGGGDNNGGSGNTGGSTGGTTTTWELVFEDNFEGTDSIPNQQYWTLAAKGDDTWNRYMSESYGQAYQKNGYLYLFGMESGGQYLTGGIETREKFDFKYGQVKCRARFLRRPQGNHTGIWMMPEPPAQKWPKSGEIDIMEHLDNQSVIYETVHFWNETEEKDDSKDTSVEIDNTEFNVYGVIWDEKSVSFTVNGEVKFTYKNDNPDSSEFSYQYPFTEPFYLILSQSLGGKGTWEGVIDNSELPAIFQIDWIKVWQKK